MVQPVSGGSMCDKRTTSFFLILDARPRLISHLVSLLKVKRNKGLILDELRERVMIDERWCPKGQLRLVFIYFLSLRLSV